MKSKKNWIYKLNDDSLNYLLKNKNNLSKTPKKLNDKSLELIRSCNKFSEKEKKHFELKLFPNINKYAFGTAVLASVIITFTFIVFISKPDFGFMAMKNISKIEELHGKANIIRNDKYSALSTDYKIQNGDVIITETGSNASVKIGENSKININELSELKIISLNKRNKNEIDKLYLTKGKIECLINLPANDSTFEIFTDTSLFTIIGTKFNLEIDSFNKVILNVFEGKVTVTNNLQNFGALNDIKGKNGNIYQQLKNTIENKIIIEKNSTITIDRSEFESMKNEINNYLKNSLDKLEKPDPNNSEKKDIINELNKFLLKHENIMTIKDDNPEISPEDTDSMASLEEKGIELIEKNIDINKLPSNNNIILSDKYTQITADNENIYLASDGNKTIYCLDAKTGNLKWKFTDENISKITTQIKPYKNELVFAAPDAVYILNKNGTLKFKKNIIGGPIYWPSFLIIKDKLLIPSFKSIYQYDGNDISIFKEFSESSGQLYISEYSGNILFIDINDKNIKEIDIDSKEIIWTSEKFIDRVFMPAVSHKNEIFLGDISGNVYEVNYQSTNKVSAMLNVKAGIISNLIYYNNHLFFVANNGTFYKININNNESKIITEVDKKSDKDKYFTKKIFSINNMIFYPTDTGNVFYYNLINNKNGFIEIKENPNQNALIGTPVKIGEKIFFIDNKANVYYLMMNK